RLFPQAIPRQRQALFLFIPYCKSEHAHQGIQGGAHTQLRYATEQYLGVAMATPTRGVFTFADLFAKLPVVIDLAVENNYIAATIRMHRLVSSLRQISNRKPG